MYVYTIYLYIMLDYYKKYVYRYYIHICFFLAIPCSDSKSQLITRRGDSPKNKRVSALRLYKYRDHHQFQNRDVGSIHVHGHTFWYDTASSALVCQRVSFHNQVDGLSLEEKTLVLKDRLH